MLGVVDFDEQRGHKHKEIIYFAWVSAALNEFRMMI